MQYEKVLKSSQEQASAAWISYLNKVRLHKLLSALETQNDNFDAAIRTLQSAKQIISDEIVNRNRGGTKGMHGFIAEVMEVAFENAENAVSGSALDATWINNNGPADFSRGEIFIQQKFVQKSFSLDAIQEHANTYPDFLKAGNKYQIPKDYYEKIKVLLNTSSEDAARLTANDTEGMSFRAWKKVHDFFNQSDIVFDDLEPSIIEYAESKRDRVEQTFSKEHKKIKNQNQAAIGDAYRTSTPSYKEGMKATVASAVLEGGMNLILRVRAKLKEGKKFSDFSEDDWKEIGLDTAVGTGKGGIRGASVYILSNYTATSAPVASSMVTAILGIASQAKRFNKGELSEDDFIINSESVCIETAISAISSILGEIVIPIPVLGAIVGNTVGMLMYGVAKDYLKKEENDLIHRFNTDIAELNKKLDEKYQKLIAKLSKEFEKFKCLLDWAFDPDVNRAFDGSIKLAEYVNVHENSTLKSMVDIDSYFLD